MGIIGSVCFSLPNICTLTALLALSARNTKMKPPFLKQLIEVGRQTLNKWTWHRGYNRGVCKWLSCLCFSLGERWFIGTLEGEIWMGLWGMTRSCIPDFGGMVTGKGKQHNWCLETEVASTLSRSSGQRPVGRAGQWRALRDIIRQWGYILWVAGLIRFKIGLIRARLNLICILERYSW